LEIHFSKRDIHKYTWISGNGEQKALMDYVLIDRREKDKLTDVNVLRGAAGGLSDHHLVVWKEVKRMWKGTSRKEERVKAKNVRLLIEKDAVRKRWAEYFERMLNVEEDREPEIAAVGRERGMNVLGDLNESLITREEVQEAVREMKAGKVAGLDGCVVECVKSGSVTVVEWLVRLLNVCFMMLPRRPQWEVLPHQV